MFPFPNFLLNLESSFLSTILPSPSPLISHLNIESSDDEDEEEVCVDRGACWARKVAPPTVVPPAVFPPAVAVAAEAVAFLTFPQRLLPERILYLMLPWHKTPKL